MKKNKQLVLNEFLALREDGVFYIGHASALARIGEMLILFDPVWDHQPYGDYWEFKPQQVNCDSVMRLVDLIVVSHIHEDHICDRIIQQAKCPVAIMSGRKNLRDRLIQNTVTVWEINPFTPIDYRGARINFIPNPKNSIDSSCFVSNIETGYTIYHGNDNFLDEKTITKAREYVVRLDVAMVPYACIHWYPWRMQNLSSRDKIKEADRMRQDCLSMARNFIQEFKPKHIIPFGASLFYVNDVDPINDLASPFEISKRPLVAGGYVTESGKGLECAIETKSEYHAITSSIDTSRIEERMRSAYENGWAVKNHDIVVNGLVLQLDSASIASVYGHRPYTMFDFEPVIFKKWLRGEITFEQAIGTRAFRCTRNPEQYKLEVFEYFNNCL